MARPSSDLNALLDPIGGRLLRCQQEVLSPTGLFTFLQLPIPHNLKKIEEDNVQNLNRIAEMERIVESLKEKEKKLEEENVELKEQQNTFYNILKKKREIIRNQTR